MKAAHAAEMLQMQSENHKQVVSLLQAQLMLLMQERDKHENTLSSQVTNMYREKDKDRADKDLLSLSFRQEPVVRTHGLP